jgi:phytol kinase
VYGALLAWTAGRVVRVVPASSPYPRKVFHVGIFTGAAPVHLIFGFWGLVLYGVGISMQVLYSYWRGREGALYRVLARPEDGPAQRRYIFLPLVSTALGGLSSVLLVGSFAVVGFLVCGWGDAAGESVGSRWGLHRYPVPAFGGKRRTRSLEGSAAVLLAGSLGAWGALGLLGFSPLSAIGVGCLCGLVGALTEAVSSHGTDNLFTQLLPALSAWWILG